MSLIFDGSKRRQGLYQVASLSKTASNLGLAASFEGKAAAAQARCVCSGKSNFVLVLGTWYFLIKGRPLRLVV